MLLPKIIDAIVLGTKKINDSMYALDHVQVTDSTVYATNGHSLYYASTKTFQNDDDYPDVFDNTNNTMELSEPVVIPRTAIDKAIKNRPKKGMSVLTDNIQLSYNDSKLHLTTTDLETTDTVTCKNQFLEFPRVTQIIDVLPDHENNSDVKSVILSVVELELLCKIAKKASEESVKLTIESPTSPVRVTPTNNSFTGVIMPLVLD